MKHTTCFTNIIKRSVLLFSMLFIVSFLFADSRHGARKRTYTAPFEKIVWQLEQESFAITGVEELQEIYYYFENDEVIMIGKKNGDLFELDTDPYTLITPSSIETLGSTVILTVTGNTLILSFKENNKRTTIYLKKTSKPTAEQIKAVVYQTN